MYRWAARKSRHVELAEHGYPHTLNISKNSKDVYPFAHKEQNVKKKDAYSVPIYALIFALGCSITAMGRH